MPEQTDTPGEPAVTTSAEQIRAVSAQQTRAISAEQDTALASEQSPAAFTVGYVHGVTPAKWVRIWNQRRPDLPLELITTDDADQIDVLRDGRARMAFVRLPIDRNGLNTIPLYSELAVAVVPTDHVIAAVDEIDSADLDGETIHDVGPIDDTLALVAAGTGVAIVPQSIARLHARRDLTYRPITDAPTTDIVLAWIADDRALDPLERGAVQDFIGIVRGRTARSSRGSVDAPTAARDGKSDGVSGEKAGSRAKAAKGAKPDKGAKNSRGAKASGTKSSAGGNSARRSGSSTGSGKKRPTGKRKRK